MGIFASKRTSRKANIVFVHGFWADGSGWSKVIPALQAQGHFVVAAQHAHTSLADDVAATRQLLTELEGPTLLVGHSYGGFVISEAANDAPGVVGLVYISAFMLDEGETLLSSGANFPPLEVFGHLLVTGQGYAWIDPDVFPQNFANDLDRWRHARWQSPRCPPMPVSSRRKPGGLHGSPCHRGRCLAPRIA